MTQDEIIEMVREAGFFVKDNDAYSPSVQEDHELTPFLVAFAKLVAAKEREALAQHDSVQAKTEPEQEPVAYLCENAVGHKYFRWKKPSSTYKPIALYTTPPQRTWVGLTEDDKVLIKHDANFNQFMTAGEYADRVQALTEARLKDKNT